MKTLLLFLLSTLTVLGQSVELRSVTILGGVEIGQAAAGAAPGGISNPSNVNVICWYQADGITNNASDVSFWLDKGGHAYTLTNEPTRNPVYYSSIKNGKGAVYFNQFDHMMVAFADAYAQPIYFFAALQNRYNEATLMHIAGGTNASTDNCNVLYGAKTNFEARSGATLTPGSNFDTNNWYVLTVCFSGANSFIRTNGVQIGAEGNAGTAGLSGLSLGAAGDSGARWKGWMAEFFYLTNSLTAQEMTNMETYLNGLYSIY